MHASFNEMMAEKVKWGLSAEMMHDRSLEESPNCVEAVFGNRSREHTERATADCIARPRDIFHHNRLHLWRWQRPGFVPADSNVCF